MGTLQVIPGHEPRLINAMPPMRLIVLLLCSAALCAGEAAGLAFAQRGAVFNGAIRQEGKGVSIGGTVLPWGDAALVALPGTMTPVIDAGVVTSDGEVLRGMPRQIEQGELVFAGDLHGVRRIPLAGLAAILLAPLPLGDLDGILANGTGAVLANGERVAGTLTFCNAEAIGIDTGRRVAQVPRQRVAAVVLRAPRGAQASRERTWFALATGDRLLVDGVASAGGGLQIKGPSGTVAIDQRLLTLVWNDGGRITQLAGVPPVRAAAVDRIGAMLPVIPGVGFPLRIAGLTAGSGVLVPARGEIAWKSGGNTSLLVWVACPEGSDGAIASIVLDGNVAWEQPVRAGAAAMPLAIPLKGAAEVALRTAPGPSGETARCTLAWCHPLLVK